MRIDAHQHFWQYSPAEYGWIDGTLTDLKRDFLPADLVPLLAANGFDGTVAVEARQSLAETDWLLKLAEDYDFIKGVVGWVDLQAEDVGAQLEKYAEQHKLKGIRHAVQGESDDHFMLRPEFLRGLGLLHGFGLTYDLLLFPRHLPIALDVVRRFPNQKFVLDHIAKPSIKAGVIDPWARDLRELAQFGNVCCKVSGMVTEADWENWQAADLRPYLDVVFDAFGADRLLFGSDWPVCTVAATYERVVGIVRDYVGQFPAEAHDRVFGGNASAFYNL